MGRYDGEDYTDAHYTRINLERANDKIDSLESEVEIWKKRALAAESLVEKVRETHIGRELIGKGER